MSAEEQPCAQHAGGDRVGQCQPLGTGHWRCQRVFSVSRPPPMRDFRHIKTLTHRKRTFSVVTSPGLVFHVHVGVKKSVCRSIYAEENVTLFAFDIFSK